MGFLFWCLRLQFWSYYDHVVTGMTILEDGIKKEDNIKIKANKKFSYTKYFKTNIFFKIFFKTISLNEKGTLLDS